MAKNWTPISGVINCCKFCGEQTPTKVIYCVTCKTQEKRKQVYEQNVAIMKENKAKGFEVPATLRSWR